MCVPLPVRATIGEVIVWGEDAAAQPVPVQTAFVQLSHPGPKVQATSRVSGIGIGVGVAVDEGVVVGSGAASSMGDGDGEEAVGAAEEVRPGVSVGVGVVLGGALGASVGDGVTLGEGAIEADGEGDAMTCAPVVGTGVATTAMSVTLATAEIVVASRLAIGAAASATPGMSTATMTAIPNAYSSPVCPGRRSAIVAPPHPAAR
jgi:hypothetical protein